MKKRIYTIIISAVICISMLISVISFASSYNFEVNINGSSVVSVGESFSYSITVDEIQDENGVLGGNIEIEFDKDIFQFVSLTAEEVTHWNMDSDTSEASNGLIALFPADSDGIGGTTVKENGKIKYTLTLTVNETLETTGTIRVKSASLNSSTLDPIENGNLKSLNITVKHSLSAPTELSWDGTKAKWEAVENASSYSVQLYRNGEEFGDSVEETGTEHDFASVTDGGKYTFTVIALSDSEAYGDSTESAKSTERIVKGKLVAPVIKISTNLAAGGLKYQITDTNESDTVSGYTVKVYNGDTLAKTLELSPSAKAGNIQLDTDITGGTKYTATVTAITSDAELNDSSDESAKCAEAEAAKSVDSISFENAPATEYYENTALNLADVTILITYSDSSTKSVGFADFETYGIDLNVDNGQILTLSDNGLVIKATLGSGSSKKTASSAKITVIESTCKHANTHIETKDATCGADGYENTICSDCGATITVKILPATGVHTFGDWTVTLQPTATRKGLKEHVCSVCQYTEAEEIPATGVTTEEESKTDAATTEAEETTKKEAVTDKGSSMDDLSRIFMIIIIVIFVIIILIIVVSIAIERKKARERRRRAAQRARRRPPQQ